MGDVKMRRENIRYEARGKSFEIECPSGFSGIEAIVVTTPLVLVVAALAPVECLLRMVSGALTRLGISILRTLKGGE